MKNDKKKNKGIIIISMFCLLMTIIPAFLVFMGIITSELNKLLMLIGTVGWFVTAPYWLNRKNEEDVPVS